jgi:hypothetical protein
MPTNYTLTYNGNEVDHDQCEINTNSVNFRLPLDGKVEFVEASGAAHFVDLLTIYYTPNGVGEFPTPEKFTINIDNPMGKTVEPVLPAASNNGTSITREEEEGTWILTVNGPPTNDNITTYQLNSNGLTPPNKLKIRVKRQPAFNCSTGTFDDRP